MALKLERALPYLSPAQSVDDTAPLFAYGADGPIVRPFSESLRITYMLDEPGALPMEDRRRVLAALRLVSANDPWALLGVDRGADKKALKRAFFERSKLFHPDRFYGKSLGKYLSRLHTVFEALSRAHADLTDDGTSRRSADGVSIGRKP